MGNDESLKWTLYDNFNRGKSVKKRLWKVSHNQEFGGATVKIRNKKLSFTHDAGSASGARSWVQFKVKPETIKGVRVDISTSRRCEGDIRGRFGHYTGGVPGSRDRVWSEMQVRPAFNRLGFYSGRQKRNREWKGELINGRMPTNTEVRGRKYRMEATWDRDHIRFAFKGKGVNLDNRIGTAVSTYEFVKKLKKLKKKDLFIALGSRSSADDSGPCTVFFDNVFVAR